ncbi:MAG: glycosyltransferase [Nocardioides sp.]|nr:glycosyltransferase [Nocardioides sp.]
MTSDNHPEEGASRRLHVLHVSASGSGAVGAVALGYVRDQVARGWNVSVACSSHGFLGYDARAAGARTHWWQAEREPNRRVVGEYVSLSRIIKDADPDVVHLHSSKAGLVGRLVLRERIPTVFQPHAWSYLAARGGVRAASLRWERFATDGDHGLRERRGAGRRWKPGHRWAHRRGPQRRRADVVPPRERPRPGRRPQGARTGGRADRGLHRRADAPARPGGPPLRVAARHRRAAARAAGARG